jgi:hypothetical protein
MITKDMIEAAQNVMTDVQARVYFNKLAALGVTASNEEEAETLWQLGDRVLQERPRLSEAGRVTKQAGIETFGAKSSAPAADGCSHDAHRIAEELCQDQNIMKAAHLLLAVQNAASP